MNEKERLIKMSKECEKKFRKYLKKHDIHMAIFYNNASQGYRIKVYKLKCL